MEHAGVYVGMHVWLTLKRGECKVTRTIHCKDLFNLRTRKYRYLDQSRKAANFLVWEQDRSIQKPNPKTQYSTRNVYTISLRDWGRSYIWKQKITTTKNRSYSLPKHGTAEQQQSTNYFHVRTKLIIKNENAPIATASALLISWSHTKTLKIWYKRFFNPTRVLL